MGCCALFQGIFPAQGSNLQPLLRLVHCRQSLYRGATLDAWFLLYNTEFSHNWFTPPSWASHHCAATRLGHHRARSWAPGHAAASHELSVLHLIVQICQCCSLGLSQCPSSTVSTSPFSTSVSLPVLQIDSLVSFFQIPYIYVCVCVWIYDICFFFFLISLCRTGSGFIHITPNDPISFLLMTE